MPNKKPNLPRLTAQDERAEHCVLCRESTLYDYALMDGMIGQTVGSNLHLPGARDVLEAGLAPITGTSNFEVFRYQKYKTRGYLFEHCGVIYVYVLGSAAAPTQSKSENAAVELICDVLAKYRPRNLYVATFSRLVRSMEFSGRLFGVARDNVEVIHCGDMKIDLSTPAGKAMWMTFAMVADMERDAIVQRMFAGLVNKYQRGQYILNEEAIPPGYVLGPDRKVHYDASMKSAVRTLFELIADPTLTARQVMDQAGALGITSRTIKRIHGPNATYANLSRADSRIASLIDWIPTYRTGRVEIFRPNPFPGARRFGPLAVEGYELDRRGFVRFTYDWGVPPGGWAPDDILTAAEQRTKGRKERMSGRLGPRRRRPFAGWVRWQAAGHEYRIGSGGGMYVIERRELVDAGGPA